VTIGEKMAKFDLLVKGGFLVDPAGGRGHAEIAGIPEKTGPG